jgi:hypothetical protein
VADCEHPDCGWSAVTTEADQSGFLIARRALWVPSAGETEPAPDDESTAPDRWSEFAVWQDGGWQPMKR